MFFSQRSEEIIGKSRMWNEANEVSAKMETLFGKKLQGKCRQTSSGSTIRTLLYGKINPKDLTCCKSLGDAGFQWQMKVSVGILY